MENLAITGKEFLCCAFSDNEQNLVTLAGQGDWCVILWVWEQQKMIAKVDFAVIEPLESRMFQMSFMQIMGQVVVVTGPGTFKYYKLEEGTRTFKEVHS